MIYIIYKVYIDRPTPIDFAYCEDEAIRKVKIYNTKIKPLIYHYYKELERSSLKFLNPSY